ncbi:hypothetical protein KIW84_023270 [Lathyrus oleraceus]|uniref:Uncharacterized protein n=1 Tax=Pisum sativum TaxID=3888 RepID=A0A9D4YDQ8_PEA|nr:hypothetical protein KIW84_023270 [Pisum sativum]
MHNEPATMPKLNSKWSHPTGPNQRLSAANSSALLRNHGAAPALHSGQALNSMDNFQPTMFKQPTGFGVQDERFKSFQIPSQRNIDRREFEDDLKKFPRHPLDAEPDSKYGNYSLGPHEAGKRPVGFHDDAIKKPNSNLHSGHLGPGPGYGIHPMDGMAPRSPGSEYTDMPSCRFGPLSGGLISKSGIDDFEGRTAS